MKCSKCGNEVISGAIFCDNCGNKITNETASNVCPNCGEGYATGSEFCGNCGNKLSSAVVVETRSESITKRVCPSCKTEWDDDVDFCGECGTALLKSSMTYADTRGIFDDKSTLAATDIKIETINKIKCKNCGCDLDSEAEFCGNCGTTVNGESVHSIPDSSTVTHSMKSTMRETTKETDPKKIADNERGNGFFSKAGELD